MFKSRHFNQRFFSAYYFDGGIAPSNTARYFASKSFAAQYFDALNTNETGDAGITLVPTSIAIEVLPSSVTLYSQVTAIAYVYDQFNKAMEGISVTFGSSNPAVLSVPAPTATDSLGRAVRLVTTSATGTTNFSATVLGLSAFVVVTVSGSGGITHSLTHGATIQAGNAGGGSPGPIKIKLTRRVKRWPTR